MNVASVVEGHVGSQHALHYENESLTYAELRAWAGVVRARLVAAGVARGDRVLVACGNEPAFVAAILAILGVGAVGIPLNPFNPTIEIRRRVDALKPKAVVVGTDEPWPIDAQSGIIPARVSVEPRGEVAGPTAPVVDCDANDLALMMLTSGVSATPKVAMLSHGNLAWALGANCGGEHGVSGDDVTLGVLPFAHIAGLVVLLSSLNAGGVCVLQQRFDADATVGLIGRHGVTRLAAVPPIWRRLASSSRREALSSVRYASSGAAMLPMEVFEAVADRLSLELAQAYGLTETSALVSHNRGFEIRPASVGKPVDGVDVRVVDSYGSPAPAGDTGEIVVRSPGVFQGYWGDAEGTDKVLSADGWLWTGDVGAFDDDGYLFLVDRVKDLIIVSGFNVYPTEVEDALKEHPGVNEAVVVGVASDATGEAVAAHVNGDVPQGELELFVKARLSGYKCPTEYRFSESLPIAVSGKVERRSLRP